MLDTAAIRTEIQIATQLVPVAATTTNVLNPTMPDPRTTAATFILRSFRARASMAFIFSAEQSHSLAHRICPSYTSCGGSGAITASWNVYPELFVHATGY